MSRFLHNWLIYVAWLAELQAAADRFYCFVQAEKVHLIALGNPISTLPAVGAGSSYTRNANHLIIISIHQKQFIGW